MFPLNSVRNWRADAICPYDLARIVFVGTTFTTCRYSAESYGVSTSVTPYKIESEQFYKPEFVFVLMSKQKPPGNRTVLNYKELFVFLLLAEKNHLNREIEEELNTSTDRT